MRQLDSVRLRALLSLGIVAGFGAVGTLAAWTDSATATAQFSAGTLDLTLNGEADDAVDLTSLTMTNMYPGSAKAAVLTVANTGSLPFAYNFATTATGNAALATALTLSVAPGGLAADGINCAGTALSLGSASLAGSSLTSARTLAPAAAEQLCIRVSLPAAADNSLQGTSTTATLTFTASQAG